MDEAEIVAILMAIGRGDAADFLGPVRHLLDPFTDAVRFYHESLRDFVINVTSAVDLQIHTSLAVYCDHSNTNYAVTNLLHHHLRVRAPGRQASQKCSQAWLDEAALRCVPPELLLEDLREAVEVVASLGDCAETVRLLLLNSRIHYRYNNALALHAADFAKAAIALRSPAQAIRFITRQGQPICSTADTISVLRLLMIHCQYEHAIALYADMRRWFWVQLENDRLTYDRLLQQLVATVLIAMTASDEDEVDEHITQMKSLRKMLEIALEHSGADEKKKGQWHARSCGLSGGEMLWHRGFTIPMTDDALELAIVSETADQISLEHGFKAAYPERHPMLDQRRVLENDAIGNALKTRVAAGKIRSGEELLVARALMKRSDGFDLVGSLFDTFQPLLLEVSIRLENGVDSNLLGLERLLLAKEIQGYTAAGEHSARVAVTARHRWEKRLLDSAACLGRLTGTQYRQRALGSSEQSLIENLKMQFLPHLRFSLSERAEWQDAYHIPEAIVPSLISRALSVICDVEPESASAIAEVILEHGEKQFGLYTEGYTRLLAWSANALGTIPQGVQSAADLRRRLRAHVSKGVFARRERIACLLDCAQHLARLGASEDAETAFQEAIGSSLGPSWYKQGQFNLLTNTLEAVGDASFSRRQWKRVIEMLAYASGELTFQRFVRDAKSDIIEHLSHICCHGEALATFLFYLLPTYRLQKRRVECIDVDMKSHLSGGRFGVQEVDEQRAALALLSGLGAASPPRRWAVVELFWPWGDPRHLDEFAETTCDLLGTRASETIGQRFLRMLRADVDPDRRSELVDGVRSKDQNGVASVWLERARALRIIGDEQVPRSMERNPRRSDVKENDASGRDESEEDELFLPGKFGRKAAIRALRDAISKAEERISRDDRQGARSLLVEGLRVAQAGGWGIWEPIFDGTDALELLLRKTGSLEKALSALAELIAAEANAADWVMAGRLLPVVMPALDPEHRLELFTILADHIALLVGPEQDTFSLQSELDCLPDDVPAISPNQCIDQLMVSLLDHPNSHMRDRAADVVVWLIANDEFEFEFLVERIGSRGIGDGKEIAIGIIHRAISVMPELADRIVECRDFQALKTESCFLVRFLLESILRQPRSQGAALPTAARNTIERSQADVFAFEDARVFLKHKAGNRAVAEDWLDMLCEPLTPAQVRELHEIRCRAFGNQPGMRGKSFEREALYRAVADAEPDSAIGRAFLDAAIWNPMWPDAELSLHGSPLTTEMLAKLELPKFEHPFQSCGRTILHCIECEPNADGTTKITEVVAVLVPKEFFDGNLDPARAALRISVFDKKLPVPARSLLATIQEPAIARFEPYFRVGGDITPALPTECLKRLIGSDGFRRTAWRNGRSWGVWGPDRVLSRGVALCVDSNRLLAMREFDLVWVVFQQGEVTHVVDAVRRRVYGGSDER